jgi:hypothetical protein
LNSIRETSERRFHQYLCGCRRVQDLFGGRYPVGQGPKQPFQLSFNAFLKIDYKVRASLPMAVRSWYASSTSGWGLEN